MNGIYFKEGIYVAIDDGKSQNDICVYNYHKDNVSLYGGRIRITYSSEEEANLYVDGISIIKISDKKIQSALLLSEIASHLNAIETNGVDTFLEHYKKSVEFLYTELKELNQKTESQLTIEQEDSKIKSLLVELTKIRDLLFSVLAILFSLNTYMSAGLENEKVISICQSVMDSLA
ncbi:MAG: hypothetical protein QMB79_03875 [Cloacibacterium sp.]